MELYVAGFNAFNQLSFIDDATANKNHEGSKDIVSKDNKDLKDVVSKDHEDPKDINTFKKVLTAKEIQVELTGLSFTIGTNKCFHHILHAFFALLSPLLVLFVRFLFICSSLKSYSERQRQCQRRWNQ